MNKKAQIWALQYISEKTQECMMEIALSADAIDPLMLSGWFHEFYDLKDWLNDRKHAEIADEVWDAMRALLGMPA